MKVGRFQVMSVLQAARAYTLGLPLESAQSWGLNRAIFYAAAKRGFKGGGGSESKSGKGTGTKRNEEVYHLADGTDMAFRAKGKTVLFTIGGKVQTKEDYERHVRARFGGSYPAAWKEALAYVKKFDRETLLSGEGFFGGVYRPVRDDWADKWTEASEPKRK